MKKLLFLGIAAGVAAAAAAALIYKKKRDEFCDYGEDIDDDFEYDSNFCDDCDMPDEKPADGSIETDNCTASNASTDTDGSHDNDSNDSNPTSYNYNSVI